ncbi:hypothetical protein niasHS_000867 [Heterodera schachtii]|uniref:Uncharacterized protein n=1 Tax=Heterodera schachtii TaxID=97005 RepID=A0ABD2KLY2_HETSC
MEKRQRSDRWAAGGIHGGHTVSAVHYSITTTSTTHHQQQVKMMMMLIATSDQKLRPPVESLESADGDRVIRRDRKLANAAPAQRSGAG